MSGNQETSKGFTPGRIYRGLKRRTLNSVEWVHNLMLPLQPLPQVGPELAEITEIRQHAHKRTDISEHLLPLFLEALAAKPRLIVELGVRSGESTFAFERVAKLCNSTLLSVDIDDCLRASTWKDWSFVKSDDIAFARQFPEWCAARGMKPEIDVLFIDTSHLYDHTVQEIKSWFPYLSQKAKVFFHDTNQREVYFRADKSMGIGWDSNRGVIRALQEYLGVNFNENISFTDTYKGWIIRHNALCSGFTVLERLDLSTENNSLSKDRDAVYESVGSR